MTQRRFFNVSRLADGFKVSREALMFRSLFLYSPLYCSLVRFSNRFRLEFFTIELGIGKLLITMDLFVLSSYKLLLKLSDVSLQAITLGSLYHFS